MNEKGEFTPEEAAEEKKSEPTSEEIAEACQEVLTEDDCQEIAGLPFDEALGYAFTLLIENGIEDPEAFMKEKGILE